VFGIDAMPLGVKFATPAACPYFGGKVVHVDDAKAKRIPGVRQVLVFDNFVAVVGDHMWAAKQGLAALVIGWDKGPNAKVGSDTVWKQIRAASQRSGVVAKAAGDAAKAIAQGERLDAAYEMPLLAHAPMEPMNCTVHVRADSCEVWVGTLKDYVRTEEGNAKAQARAEPRGIRPPARATLRHDDANKSETDGIEPESEQVPGVEHLLSTTADSAVAK
jgi:hypothetical protein